MALVYFDTCIWISALERDDSDHARALTLFDQVKKGKFTLLVTHHVINEVLDYVKQESAIKERDEAKAESLTKSTYDQFSSTLLQFPNVRIKNPYNPTHSVFRMAFSLLYKYLRGMSTKDDCPICHTSFPYVSFDTISRDDALHVVLAWCLNCDVFKSFDKDFQKLANETSLAPMHIEVVTK